MGNTEELELKKIPLGKLEIAPTNVRKHYVEAGLDDLRFSLLEIGQTDVVYAVPNGDKYSVYRGQRRVIVAKKLMELGKPVLDLWVIVKNITPKQQLLESLVDSKFVGLSSEIDVAKGIEAVLKAGATKLEALRALGIKEEELSYYLNLLGATEPELLTETEIEFRRLREYYRIPETK